MLGERGRRLLRIADLQTRKDRSAGLFDAVQRSANASGESSHIPPRNEGNSNARQLTPVKLHKGSKEGQHSC